LRDPSPQAQTGSGFFWARIPTGKRFVVTTVKNPATNTGSLSVSVNEISPAPATVIAGGATVQVRTPLPEGLTNVCVRYAGEKTLVLLETAFE
jgi:hypothetical protein